MTTLLLAAGLSMDAFAVSVTNGLSGSRMPRWMLLFMAAVFGTAQGMMPALGFLLGQRFAAQIASVDHYLALVILGGIGLKMLLDARHEPDVSDVPVLSCRTILLQGIATSLDAMAAGLSFSAMPDVRMLPACVTIAGITAAMSFLGAWGGRRLGRLCGCYAQSAGGLVLMLLGLWIFCRDLWGV
ncbi:MAG: manganese efflux pump [Oscillospiraceae bacterium]|nr:manganese efflux pump [Oscillospiraceae bacterium]